MITFFHCEVRDILVELLQILRRHRLKFQFTLLNGILLEWMGRVESLAVACWVATEIGIHCTDHTEAHVSGNCVPNTEFVPNTELFLHLILILKIATKLAEKIYALFATTALCLDGLRILLPRLCYLHESISQFSLHWPKILGVLLIIISPMIIKACFQSCYVLLPYSS